MPPELQGDVVLVVDDSPEALAFLTEAMQADGTTVLVARSGEAALSIVEKIVPDIVLMDAVMPGLDGFETCTRLKAMARIAHVPVIFMTGLTETEHVVRALDAGGVDYLTKPIHLDELQARIRVHLANARRAQGAAVALDATGRHLVALGQDGVPHWSTPQARKLLDERPGLEARLGEGAAYWLADHPSGEGPTGATVTLAGAGTQGLSLVYLGAIGPNEHLFRVLQAGEDGQHERLRAHFGLTPRESEVLLWIAHGKSNRDIGEILGLSPRTVNKHLEQVYQKLGVENRASAAVRATHLLTGGDI